MLLSKNYTLLLKLKFVLCLPTKSFKGRVFPSVLVILGIRCLMSQEVPINSCSTSNCIGLKGVANFLSNMYDFWWDNKKHKLLGSAFGTPDIRTYVATLLSGEPNDAGEPEKSQENHLAAPSPGGLLSKHWIPGTLSLLLPTKTWCCCYLEKLRHKGKASTSKVRPKSFHLFHELLGHLQRIKLEPWLHL